MGICWYCHWGWPKQVYDIYAAGVAAAGEGAMHYGPAHIVWEDENFEDGHIQTCLEHATTYAEEWDSRGYSPEQIAAVVKSLEDLLKVPEEIRMCQPDDYDDEHPEKYPPPAGLKMIRF